ncbi:MAG TPA: ELWxxDGT repeat protein [Thermoanaerobaculia bacterium]|nr:ELWxxDGT repeat protein [Thermoanaerobaculia bacterium]
MRRFRSVVHVAWIAVAAGSALPAHSLSSLPYLVKDIEPVNASRVYTCGVPSIGLPPPAPFNPGSLPSQLTEVAGRLYFTANDLVHGQELWTSDGTAEGTVLTADICPGGCGSFPTILGSYRDALLLVANDPAGGRALYAFDTATRVVTLLREICPLCAISDVEWPCLHPLVRPTVRLGGALYFIVASGTAEALWRTDGTAAGTVKLDDVCDSIRFDCHQYPAPLAAPDGGLLYLVSGFGGYGGTLRRSNGVPGGSASLVTVCPDYTYAHFSAFAEVGGKFVFAVTCDYPDSYLRNTSGVWVSDGTAPGTQLLLDGPGSNGAISQPIAAGQRAFFSIWPAGSLGISPGPSDLWQTDGTPAGTARIADPRLFDAQPAAALGQALVFVASDLAGSYGLWRLDPGSGAASFVAPAHQGLQFLLRVVDGVLLFERFDPPNAHSLWRSDGTPAGTWSVPSAAGALQEFTAAGSRVFFQAADDAHGAELWAADRGALTGVSCLADETKLCLAGGRFAVSVRFQDPFGSGARLEGHALPPPAASGAGDQSGLFWFFSPDDVELIVKVLDGHAVNQSFWVFYGALSDVEYWLTVTDTKTGVTKTYHNPAGTLCGSADVGAFLSPTASPPAIASDGLRAPGIAGPGGIAARSLATIAGGKSAPAADGLAARQPPVRAAALPGSMPAPPSSTAVSCSAGPQALCLLGGRFRAEVAWRTPHDGGAGNGYAVPQSDGSGFFWFWSAGSLELAVKVLDGTPVNSHFWLFYGALTDVEYTLTVTDTATGAARTYHNSAGNLCGSADVTAF